MFPSVPERLRGTLSLWVVLFLVWTAANSSLSLEVAAVGLVLTFCISVVLTRRSRIWDDLSFTPQKAWSFVYFTGVFLREMFVSNLKVMQKTYAPSVDVQPAVVPARSDLKSPFARFVLINAVALTPGTLVLWVEGKSIFVHVLDMETNEPGDINANSENFLGSFDPILARVFG